MPNTKTLNLKNKLSQLPLLGRRVFLRVDANVPLKNGTILDDYRLKSIIPTIESIKKKEGKSY